MEPSHNSQHVRSASLCPSSSATASLTRASPASFFAFSLVIVFLSQRVRALERSEATKPLPHGRTSVEQGISELRIWSKLKSVAAKAKASFIEPMLLFRSESFPGHNVSYNYAFSQEVPGVLLWHLSLIVRYEAPEVARNRSAVRDGLVCSQTEPVGVGDMPTSRQPASLNDSNQFLNIDRHHCVTHPVGFAFNRNLLHKVSQIKGL